MPFLNRRDIALNLRRQAEKTYKSQLRQALQNPALTADQQADIRSRLAQVGKERIYKTKPAASHPIPVQEYPEMELRKLMKIELVALAEEAGLPVSGTKVMLIRRLLACRSQGE